MISTNWIVRPRAIILQQGYWATAAQQGPLVHNFADHVMAGFDFSRLAKMLGMFL
jgi:hypothetical protein